MDDDPRATLRDGAFMQRAYELAEQAVENGDHPFGALLVHDGRIIARGLNRVESADDVTCHAELELVRDVWANFDQAIRSASVLYASTEPCLMCAGAIHWAGIPAVVFGVSARAMAEVSGHPYRGLCLSELVQHGPLGIDVVGPVMPQEGLRLHREFWPRHRDSAPDTASK
jgi:tRNA(Arg) A34 adenosine deaminase TadA